MPVRAWDFEFGSETRETYAVPESGRRPREAINGQHVQGCDILAGMFWRKLSAATGAVEGATPAATAGGRDEGTRWGWPDLGRWAKLGASAVGQGKRL